MVLVLGSRRNQRRHPAGVPGRLRPAREGRTCSSKWLVDHRPGRQLVLDPRGTALAVYALSDYIRVNRSYRPVIRSRSISAAGRPPPVSRENALLFDDRFVVADSLLRTARSRSRSRSGTGACYYTVATRFFFQEFDPRLRQRHIRHPPLLPPAPRHRSRRAGAARRGHPRPNPFLAGQFALLDQPGRKSKPRTPTPGPRYERTALRGRRYRRRGGGPHRSRGLSLEARNDYDYLAFEDVKPVPGLRSRSRSAPARGAGRLLQLELRDQKVVFFLSRIPQGTARSATASARSPRRLPRPPPTATPCTPPHSALSPQERTITVKDE